MATSAKSDRRNQRIYARKQDIISALVELYHTAEVERWTHAELLNRIHGRLPESYFRDVPGYVFDYYRGANETLLAQLFRFKFTFCYYEPGTRNWRPSHELGDKYGYANIDTENGAHCWHNESNDTYIQFNAK